MIDELQQALEQKNNEKAQQLIDALSNQQKTPCAQIPLINLCLKHGYYDLSVQCFAKAAKDCQVAVQILPLLKEPLLQEIEGLASALVKTALEAQPDNLELVVLITDHYLQQQSLSEAEVLLKDVLSRIVHPELLARLAEVYFRQNRLHEAKACALMANELTPENVQSIINLAVIERALYHLPEAANLYSKVLSLDENNFYAHINLAQLCLLSGQFDIGWQENEWRWHDPACQQRNLPLPDWQGESTTDGHLLLWADQGLGDQIMYLSLINKLDCKITVAIDERLHKLVPSSIAILPSNYTGDYSEFDFHCSLGSLPRFLVKTFQDLPVSPQYLELSGADNRSDFDKKLNHIDKAKKTLGFSWRGGTFNTAGGFRQLPLATWQYLFENSDYQWVNLQYDTTEEERLYLSSLGVHTPDFDLKLDVDSVSHCLKSLDGYIGVDNSTIHLAGALGVNSILLIAPIADWRWFTEANHCYWYQSVKLVRELNREGVYSQQWQENLLKTIKALTEVAEKPSEIYSNVT